MHKSNPTEPWQHPLTVAELPSGQTTEFSLAPDSSVRQSIAAALGVSSIRKLRFAGSLSPLGKSDWQLSARLGATAIQACVITLQPVTTRIDETIERRYVATMPDQVPGTETEIPADDTPETLGPIIELGQIMVEALALALPQFPRAPGAELAHSRFAEPGKPPMSDADARPFAPLKSLRDGLKNDTG